MKPENYVVVFDWNGVVIDDAWACFESMNVVLEHFGYAAISFDTYQNAYDTPMSRAYITAGMPEDFVKVNGDEIVRIWRKNYEERKPRIQVREGAQNALKELKEMGCCNIVLSNYVIETITEQASHFELMPHLDHVVAISKNDPPTIMRNRGKGDRLKEWIASNNVKSAAIIGDSPEETDIARACNLASISITGGCCSEGRLRAVGADDVIHSFTELPSVIQKYRRKGAVVCHSPC